MLIRLDYSEVCKRGVAVLLLFFIVGSCIGSYLNSEISMIVFPAIHPS